MNMCIVWYQPSEPSQVRPATLPDKIFLISLISQLIFIFTDLSKVNGARFARNAYVPGSFLCGTKGAAK